MWDQKSTYDLFPTLFVITSFIVFDTFQFSFIITKCKKYDFTVVSLIKELGPLNSDWFEELTVRSSEGGNDQSVAVEHEVSGHKDEGVFRAPAQTPVLDSQMCSTPRIFRRGRPQSPVSGLEDSPNSGSETNTL